ncbi:MAG: TIGR01777 family oxidoreductase [Candidatus Poribacteria bacterium]|nr:TIGR01777 family oxidoreductase [Candidatus Poribacteria bacterium]MDE0505513.1 TIGR01777 family oxidoreductase [Candidatus Poribacteria bacterium]
MENQNKPTLLVTGASGFVGRTLCGTAADNGYGVVALSRAPGAAAALLPQVNRVEAWKPDTELVPPSALADIGAIIHLTGETIGARWNADKKQRIRESRVNSTNRLVESLSKVEPKPEVLVCASAIGFYGDSGDEEFTEDSPPGNDFLAEVCQDWESEAQKAEDLGIRVVRVRFGHVLGKNGGLLKTMLPPFYMGLGGRLGSGTQWMSWIHNDDVAGIILHSIENQNVSGALNATSPMPVRNVEFTKTLGRVIRRPTFLPVPTFALKLRYGEFTDFVLMSQRVLPDKTLSLGYEFRYANLESALQASLR